MLDLNQNLNYFIRILTQPDKNREEPKNLLLGRIGSDQSRI